MLLETLVHKYVQFSWKSRIISYASSLNDLIIYYLTLSDLPRSLFLTILLYEV